jgi:16S rRNA (guanine527-N7)-methyltransferase
MIDLVKLKGLVSSHGKEFDAYCNLLLKWNKTYNLTAIKNKPEIFERHFLDSISPLPFIPKLSNLLDIGSGGGFPAIPLKICEPSLKITLLDSNRKKINFCESLCIELGLMDVSYQYKRIEEYIQPELKFDVIISRATFSVSKLIQSSALLLKNKDSLIIAMKGLNFSKELNEAAHIIKKRNIKLLNTEKYTLPSSKLSHALLIFTQS